MGKRLTEEALLEQRRRESETGELRFVDMRIDIEVGDEIVLSVGGRWDRRAKIYDPAIEYGDIELGDPSGAETGIVISPHAGQVAVVLWFVVWLGVHAGRRNTPPIFDEEMLRRIEDSEVDPSEVFAALLAGGRRGGKTWIAAVLCAIYAVLFPGAIIWVVNPTQQKHDEVRRYFSKLLQPEWIERETHTDGWELVNGSAIMLRSAYVGTDPDAIKEGEAHLVWMNEGQKMAERVYIVARGAISDSSGLVLVCANPPVQAKDQDWVTNFAAEAQAKRRQAVYHHLNPVDNPFINRLALLSLKYELDERTFRIEVLGEFLAPAERVAWNWLRTAGGNERPAPVEDDPDWVDVTEEFLRSEDLGDGFEFVIGMDFQVHPHIGGPVYKLFMPRRDPDGHINPAPTRKNVVMWGVDEVVLEGDEADWCAAAQDKGYDGDATLIIGDGTGEYQHTRRGTANAAPPSWQGKGSFDIIKMYGFRNIIRPSPRIKRNNPHVIDRVRALTSQIQSYAGTRRFFLDPVRCPKTVKSVREWPTVHGKPSRTHQAAHLGDGASYPVVRLFPRILRSEKPGQVDRGQERETVPMAKPRFLGPPSAPRHPRDRNRGL